MSDGPFFLMRGQASQAKPALADLTPQTLPEGSRWLHVWYEPVPHSDLCFLSIQTETVGIKLSAAPYVLVTPSELRKIMALFEQLPHTTLRPGCVSLSLDSDNDQVPTAKQTT